MLWRSRQGGAGPSLFVTTTRRFCEATVTCVFGAAELLRRQKSTEEGAVAVKAAELANVM
jgi:hypothetical protein